MIVGTGRGPHETVSCLAASGPRLAVGIATGDVLASAVPSGLALAAPLDISDGTANSRALCVSISSSLVALGNAHGVVTVFDTDDRSSGNGEPPPPLHFRAHPEAVRSIAWLDCVARGSRGRGSLLITMGVAAVRLWQVKQVSGQLRHGWLWELGRGSCPSMDIAVRRGRLLWLSEPSAAGRQVLQVYDFCDRQLARADALASVSLAKDEDISRVGRERDDVETFAQGTSRLSSSKTEAGWLDTKTDAEPTTDLPNAPRGGFFGSLNQLLSSGAAEQRNYSQ